MWRRAEAWRRSVVWVLTAKSVVVARGGHSILQDVSVSIGPGTRLGVVGPNGIGKSTLLAVLAGLIEPASGVVERSPASLAVGYMPQENDAEAGETLVAYLARKTGVAAAEAELDRLTAGLQTADADLDAYSASLDRFVALGGHDLEARAAEVCAELGLGGSALDRSVRDLSGGQSARARLAATLLARFDVFLLDEPTNDLDFAGLDLLESFLARVEGAVVAVSHDRAFLDHAVTRILEVQEHTHRAVETAGAWSEYVERRALRRRQEEEAHGKWQAQRAEMVDRLRSQRAWAESGVRAAKKRPKDNDKAQRDFRINRTEKQASKVRITEKALNRLGESEKPWEGWELDLGLVAGPRSGDRVASLAGAVVERGAFRLGPVDLEVAWADRIAITGPNGGGKSTLLGAMLGRVPLAAGHAHLGPGVSVGELDQRRSRLTGDESLLQAFGEDTGLLPTEARSLLAKFGLTADHVARPGHALSPGERTRAQLAALVARNVNCLVLDEPTNHLDLPAIEQLEAALEDWTGTLLVVSHDRWLLERLEVTRQLIVEDGRVREPGLASV
jgi:ATPase subunit of ABC transporter with duplicated ATPase domains